MHISHSMSAILLIASLSHVRLTSENCAKGEYFENGFCLKCQEDPNQCLSDAIVVCGDGYYWIKVNPCTGCKTCHPCSVCGLGSNLYADYTVIPCSRDSDTVCCKERNMVYIDGECKVNLTVENTTPKKVEHNFKNRSTNR